MKKIAIMALAVVLALGALGVGYALWYQDIIISGTIETGNVNIQISDASGTLVLKDLVTEDIVLVDDTVNPIPELPEAGWTIPPGYEGEGHAALLVAVAETTGLDTPIQCETPNGSVNVNVVYRNLFPLDQGAGWFCADFKMTNIGSIPVKATILTDWVPSGLDNLSFHAFTYDDTGGIIELEGYQIDPGDWVEVEVCIDVPDENTDQSLDGSFDATIEFQQWNEYVSPS